MWYVYTSSVFCIFQMYCAPFCGNCLENRKKQHIFWLVQSDNIYIYNYITIFNIIIKFNYNITIYNYNYDYIIQLLQYLIQKFTVSYDGNNSTVSIILVIFICFFCCLLEKISVLSCRLGWDAWYAFVVTYRECHCLYYWILFNQILQWAHFSRVLSGVSV